MSFDFGKFRVLLKPMLVALVWGGGLGMPGLAAEQLKVRLGPFEQSVAIADLDRFVQTGELTGTLRLYSAVLTPEVRQTLGKSLQLDPAFANQAIDNLLQSPSGQRLLAALGFVVQDTTPQQLKLALALAAQQVEGLNLIGFLKAFPGKTIAIDATSALSAASQLNLDYLESQTLNPILKQDLAIASAPFTPSFDPARPGVGAVQLQTLTLQDRQRHRRIPVDLYWSGSTPGPLVVISHGLGGDRKFLAYLARHLASHGFSVAALEHPGSNAAWFLAQKTTARSELLKGNSLLRAEEFVERPRDVSFLLDELAKTNLPTSAIPLKLNLNQVTVIGHSLGGYTALALAGGVIDLEKLRAACKGQNPLGQAPADWLQCGATALPGRQLNLRDKRVAQVIAINPLVGKLFGEGLAQVATPTLIVSGTDDAITPALDNQLRPFSQLPNPKYLLTAIGATHLSISDTAGSNSGSTLVKERLGPEVAPLRQLLQGVSLAFIQQLTPQAKRYQPFLTPAYAQSLSTPSLALRLNSALPERVARLLN